MIRGKHTDDAIRIRKLEETIKLKDKENEEVKISLAKIMKHISYLNTCGTSNEPATRRKITELAERTYYEIMKDIAITNDSNAKIIELPTRQSK